MLVQNSYQLEIYTKYKTFTYGGPSLPPLEFQNVNLLSDFSEILYESSLILVDNYDKIDNFYILGLSPLHSKILKIFIYYPILENFYMNYHYLNVS